ncbi:unnamed protein product [Cylicocyclus nassatus]|uniref:Uncharacterized protein n=1 Tax=Cylicocyclus nassatus TaxID=53992 RepID=A0AA36HAU4_CYLNA|nr:unnamed protein product [Cylicocyclus nassatus]
MWMREFILAILFAAVTAEMTLKEIKTILDVTIPPLQICTVEKDGQQKCVDAKTYCDSCKTMKDESKKNCLSFCGNDKKHI